MTESCFEDGRLAAPGDRRPEVDGYLRKAPPLGRDTSHRGGYPQRYNGYLGEGDADGGHRPPLHWNTKKRSSEPDRFLLKCCEKLGLSNGHHDRHGLRRDHHGLRHGHHGLRRGRHHRRHRHGIHRRRHHRHLRAVPSDALR